MGKNVPKLRFKGFEGEWEEKSIIEMLEEREGSIKIGPFGSALKKEFYVKEGIKVYTQENIFKNDFTLGDYYITNERYKSLESCTLKPGDLVISMMGTIGSCAVFPNNVEIGIMNSHLLRLQFKSRYNVSLIEQLLRNSELIKRQIDRLSVGSIMNGLSSTVIKQLKFNLPSLQEQEKIANLLSKIDRYIELQEKKVSELEKYKKGMMQKIFSQKIRFRKDDGGEYPEWEEKKLGDYIIEYTEKTTIKNQYPVLTSSRNGLMLQSEYFKNRQVTTEDNIGYFILPYGYITYRSRSDDGIFVFNENKLIDKGIISYFYPVFTFKKNLNNYFGVSYMNNCLKKDILREIVGTSQLVLSINKLKKFKIKVPCIQEQEKIADFFSKVDLLIQKQSKKLDELKLWKKGLLQKMFV